MKLRRNPVNKDGARLIQFYCRLKLKSEEKRAKEADERSTDDSLGSGSAIVIETFICGLLLLGQVRRLVRNVLHYRWVEVATLTI